MPVQQAPFARELEVGGKALLCSSCQKGHSGSASRFRVATWRTLGPHHWHRQKQIAGCCCFCMNIYMDAFYQASNAANRALACANKINFNNSRHTSMCYIHMHVHSCPGDVKLSHRISAASPPWNLNPKKFNGKSVRQLGKN